MRFKIHTDALITLVVAITGFSGVFLYFYTQVPGETEILKSIAELEQQPQRSTCGNPPDSATPDLLHEVLRLAHVYTVSDRYNRATPYFARAVELLRTRCGPEHAGLVGPLVLLGESYDLEGSPDKADATFNESLALRAKLMRRQDKEILLPSRVLAMSVGMLQMRGRTREVDQLTQRLEWLREREKKEAKNGSTPSSNSNQRDAYQ